jgi:hypothetical protein
LKTAKIYDSIGEFKGIIDDTLKVKDSPIKISQAIKMKRLQTA